MGSNAAPAATNDGADENMNDNNSPAGELSPSLPGALSTVARVPQQADVPSTAVSVPDGTTDSVDRACRRPPTAVQTAARPARRAKICAAEKLKAMNDSSGEE